MSLARPRVPAGLRAGQTLRKAAGEAPLVFGLIVSSPGHLDGSCDMRCACLKRAGPSSESRILRISKTFLVLRGFLTRVWRARRPFRSVTVLSNYLSYCLVR